MARFLVFVTPVTTGERSLQCPILSVVTFGYFESAQGQVAGCGNPFVCASKVTSRRPPCALRLRPAVGLSMPYGSLWASGFLLRPSRPSDGGASGGRAYSSGSRQRNMPRRYLMARAYAFLESRRPPTAICRFQRTRCRTTLSAKHQDRRPRDLSGRHAHDAALELDRRFSTRVIHFGTKDTSRDLVHNEERLLAELANLGCEIDLATLRDLRDKRFEELKADLRAVGYGNHNCSEHLFRDRAGVALRPAGWPGPCASRPGPGPRPAGSPRRTGPRLTCRSGTYPGWRSPAPR